MILRSSSSSSSSSAQTHAGDDAGGTGVPGARSGRGSGSFRTGNATSDVDDPGSSVARCFLGNGMTCSRLGWISSKSGSRSSGRGASAEGLCAVGPGSVAGSGTGANSSGMSAMRAQGTVVPAGRTRSSSRRSPRARAERMACALSRARAPGDRRERYPNWPRLPPFVSWR